MNLRIHVDPGLKKPLYQQLQEAIAEHIDSGELADGVRLPSVRDLAIDLRVNPNTVARAYRELELAGLAKSQKGIGMFVVAPARDRALGLPPDVEAALQSLIDAAHESGTPLDVIQAELQRRARRSREPNEDS